MSFNATLLRLNKKHGRIEFEISYSDGTDVVNKIYSFEKTNNEEIRKLARLEALRLQDIKDEVIDIVVGSDIDLTEPVVSPPPLPPPPTPEEIVKRIWFDDFDLLRRLEVLSGTGVILPSDGRIGLLKTSLKNSFLESYLDDM